MNKRYFCIHGHFYQPPREDAITGLIPNETGVAPYQNWNERIHAECYKPNAELGNFQKISFNLGPTLLDWMESYDPNTYRSIIQQERSNVTRFGVGNAMAQAYNHVILPLANRRDKKTQVFWGIEDFAHRFGHKPDGMWLPETAVDFETLEILIDCGITFTILAPWQAKEKGIDTSKPYRVEVGKDKSIIVFFYQMDVSTRISFDPGATSDADKFLLEFLLPAFKNNNKQELLLAASDGELYGHHQQFRDKFLNRLMSAPGSNGVISYTYPGKYIRENHILAACKISPNTSWSCHHGITRWSGECNCTPGSLWKAPLRKALNSIADYQDQIYYEQIAKYVNDPWKLRDEYISVMLRKIEFGDWIRSYNSQRLNDDELQRIKLLMESQVPRQKMFTSCGWFFDELNRIEPKNNIGYAAQATLLIEKATKGNYYDVLVSKLLDVRSSRFDIDGAGIFTEYYQRGQKNLEKVNQYFP